MTDKPWKVAIEAVLDDSGEAMSCNDIVTRVVELELRTSLGSTPHKTVSGVLTESVKKDDDSPFYRARPGLYGLKKHLQSGSPTKPRETHSPGKSDPEEDDGDSNIITALGMFWLRDAVDWKRKPSILGRQQKGADSVDFGEQRGVYLLHDRRDVVYVGRVTDRALGQRLYEHTTDRLNGRWDRFSWFGLYAVSEDGGLTKELKECSGEIVISALEAVLIESLEPPLNRQRGDNLTAVEFLQVVDPLIVKKRATELLMDSLR